MMKMLTEQEVLETMRVSRSTLARMKRSGEAPPAILVGKRRLAYRLDDLVTWLSNRLP